MGGGNQLPLRAHARAALRIARDEEARWPCDDGGQPCASVAQVMRRCPKRWLDDGRPWIARWPHVSCLLADDGRRCAPLLADRCALFCTTLRAAVRRACRDDCAAAARKIPGGAAGGGRRSGEAPTMS
ncbi:hypothetical protein F511_26320 [Dorcoceras hygrometricum]|uniref:Uncharacterized protein n=1 Tax=Dorcoceras hygrometricum TaxID=472368 RepID=A0A2Z7B2W2_9LAMI|nr:hypothetical protein F511_26320 [Dorcoceras hygrometricum]